MKGEIRGPNPDVTQPFTGQMDGVEAQRDDPTSILHLYRRLLTARRASPALASGSLQLLDGPEGVLAWQRTADGDARTVVVNMGAEPTRVPWRGTVEVCSDGTGEGEPFSGTLAPDTAVLLR